MVRFRALLMLLALTGCPGDETEATSSSGGNGACRASDSPYDTYSAGMIAAGTSGHLQIGLADATPTPPDLDRNSWTIQLLDMDGAPMPTGVTIDRVKPWMPDHGHGTSVEPVMGTIDGEGTLTVSDIDFRMPGVWTVTFEVTTPDGPDNVVFAFCIEG